MNKKKRRDVWILPTQTYQRRGRTQNNSRLTAAASEAIVWPRVSLNAEEQIKYIILSFTPFSRCSRDSEGGKKRDEERRAYWKVFVAADGALASNCIYRLRGAEIASRVVFSKRDAIVTRGNQKQIQIPNAIMKSWQVIKTTRPHRGLLEKVNVTFVLFDKDITNAFTDAHVRRFAFVFLAYVLIFGTSPWAAFGKTHIKQQ